ncbi:hypothetical protein E7Z59_09445 [Robertkochia marina]|uniref:DNA topoisomerase IV n=1 Tax=Robertkochia marina TaxID=1227945 RepID=A0A4S3M0E9_9FLAO|nr:hypothetical protein [Robertkochia marina]THD67864.1 hypothetical protein E7Z59_09445 [Robertkochia marina]TRZ42097.1 hypothetical protein D3A96_12270 [Robertkochia marina]
MKRIFPILLIFLTLQSCYQTTRDCENFKTGEFVFKYTLNGEEKESRFIRTDSMEYDYFEDHIDTNTVKWVNDCEYIVKKVNPVNLNEAKPLHFRILSTSEESYTFEYSLLGDLKNKQRGTAYKIQ